MGGQLGVYLGCPIWRNSHIRGSECLNSPMDRLESPVKGEPVLRNEACLHDYSGDRYSACIRP